MIEENRACEAEDVGQMLKISDLVKILIISFIEVCERTCTEGSLNAAHSNNDKKLQHCYLAVSSAIYSSRILLARNALCSFSRVYGTPFGL